MEMFNVWALTAALGATTLAATLKAVEFRHELKLSNDVVTGLRKEIDLLNEKHSQRISEAQETNVKLKNKISELQQQLESHNAQPLDLPPMGCA